MRKDVCINICRQRYIETVMRDTSNVGMQSCTKSCYSLNIQSVFNDQRLLMLIIAIQMKQRKLPLEFKAY